MPMLRFARKTMLRLSALGAAMALSAPAHAGLGQPSPWEIGLQEAATPVFRQAHEFHTFIVWIMAAVVLFVLALLVIVVTRFHESKHPVPSKTTHHTLLEVAWTIIPVLILVVIAVPSFRLLYAQYAIPTPDLTIKVVGRQWNWDVVYPDAGDLTMTQLMLQPEELQPGDLNKLATDNNAVVPVNKVVRVEVTADDVIHAFTIPSFGVKVDAIPGRLNETWFKAEKEGVYHGQCSELCGYQHAGMPITIQVVSEELYEKWLAAAKTDLEGAKKVLQEAKAEAPATTVAAR